MGMKNSNPPTSLKLFQLNSYYRPPVKQKKAMRVAYYNNQKSKCNNSTLTYKKKTKKNHCVDNKMKEVAKEEAILGVCRHQVDVLSSPLQPTHQHLFQMHSRVDIPKEKQPS